MSDPKTWAHHGHRPVRADRSVMPKCKICGRGATGRYKDEYYCGKHLDLAFLRDEAAGAG